MELELANCYGYGIGGFIEANDAHVYQNNTVLDFCLFKQQWIHRSPKSMHVT